VAALYLLEWIIRLGVPSGDENVKQGRLKTTAKFKRGDQSCKIRGGGSPNFTFALGVN